MLGPAREALRAGQLNLEMAVRVHEWIQNRFGGGLWMDGDRPVMTTDPDSPEAQSLPAEFAGPMSALERSHLRRVIDASLATGSDEHLHEAIQTLDTTPWTDADRHIRDRAVAAVLAGQKHYVWLFSWALAMKSGPEDLPLFEQLKSVLRGEVRSEVAEQALRFRLRHGLKAPRRGTKPAPAATSERVVGTRQWMDEDD